jgi:DNA polymerase
MGKDKFHSTLKIGQAGVSVDMPLADCERVVSLYRQTYSKIAALWKDGQAALEAMSKGFSYELGVSKLLCDGDGIHLPNGMLLRYANLRKDAEGQYVYDTRYGPNKIYGGKVIENVVQALARIVVFDQMAKIDQELRKLDSDTERYRVVLTVHDEVVVVVPDHAVDHWKQRMLELMSVAPKWCSDLPVACEAESGLNYADCK